MVSGLYLGEVARLATLAALQREGSSVPNSLKTPNSIDTATISHLLADEKLTESPLRELDKHSIAVLRRVAEAVIDRSAATAAAALAAVIHKATVGKESRRCEVGIDGSLFTKGHEYKTRLLRHLSKFHPDQHIELDFSEDGSGLGAALVAAAISRGRQVSDI
jgi:hexokinase